MSTVALFFLSPLLKWLTVTTVVGALGIAGFFLVPAPIAALWPHLRTWCLIVGVSALCGGTFYWKAFHDGETHMAQRVAAKDAAAIRRVQDSLREVDSCNGGVDWDVTTGTCRGATR